MYYYKIYNSYLKSDIELEQLIKYSPYEGEKADILLKYCSFSEEQLEKLGKNNCSACVTEKEVIFRNEYGIFLVSDGNYIQIYPHEKEKLQTLHPFILGYCMAMIFWQRGQMAIHCSAVEVDGNVVIIAGCSGSGKSTLTNRLLESGNRLVSDDVVIISLKEENGVLRAYALPAFPQQKLCRDAAKRNCYDLSELKYIDEQKDKFAIACKEKFCEAVLPVRAIINLCTGNISEPGLFEITGHDKIKLVLDNLFLKPMFDAEGGFSVKDMSACIKIAASVDVYRLYRPLSNDTTKLQEKLIKEGILCRQYGE